MTLPPRLSPDMALFLDFDGTLVEIAPTPDAVCATSGVVNSLSSVFSALNGALAIISGRSVKQIDHFLAPACLPVAGLHGLERRLTLEKGLVEASSWPGIPELREKLTLSNLLVNGTFLEDKGCTLAIHYRANPTRQEVVRTAVREMVAQLPSLHAIDGNMVVEVKPIGEDKGTAVRRFLQLPNFKNRIPVFIGDDVTDEDGICAVQQLGGYGIKVGAQKSDAIFRLPDVASVHDWLEKPYIESFFEHELNANIKALKSPSER